jgi:hypothetical protein
MRFALISPSAALPDLSKSSNWQQKRSGQLLRPERKAPKPAAGSLASYRQLRTSRGVAGGAWAEKSLLTVAGGLFRIDLAPKSTADSAVRDSWFSCAWISIYTGDSYLESLRFPKGKSIFSTPTSGEITIKIKPVAWIPRLQYKLDVFTGELPSPIYLDPDYNGLNSDFFAEQDQDYGNVTDAGYV